jgi:type IV fimbrial biogenesis protein FimT
MLASQRRRARGLTLVELAVVITVLSLLILAVAPSIGEWVRNTRVRSTATSIQAGLTTARNEALRRNAPVRFSLVSLPSGAMDSNCALSSNGTGWVVSINSPAGKCGADPSDSADPMIVEKQVGGSVASTVVVSATLADKTGTPDSVTFNGFGRVADTTFMQSINVDNQVSGGDVRKLRIEIGAGGTIRLCDTKVTDGTDPRRCLNPL